MNRLRLCCLAKWSLMLTLGSTGGAIGQASDQSSSRADVPISFDLPVQPLARALDAYSAATGLMVLYDSNLAEGHRSTAVKGALMPDVAIRVLLEGTGLTVFNAGRAFGIGAESSGQRGAALALGAAELPYLALIQQAIQRAFCESSETEPGQYRAALQFRIGTSGEVLSPELLSSTGNQERDRSIVETLSRLRIQRGPPPGMAQPVSMIISPRPPEQSGDCGRVGHQSKP